LAPQRSAPAQLFLFGLFVFSFFLPEFFTPAFDFLLAPLILWAILAADTRYLCAACTCGQAIFTTHLGEDGTCPASAQFVVGEIQIRLELKSRRCARVARAGIYN